MYETSSNPVFDSFQGTDCHKNGYRPPATFITYETRRVPTCTGGNNMSLIITMQNEHGIIFTADSRSTSEDSLGSMRLSDQREVKKVFASKNFIVATFGKNTFLRNKATLPIEMTIGSIINAEPVLSPQEFIDRLRNQLRETFDADTSAVYHIVIGYPVSRGFCQDHCILSPSGMNVQPAFGNQLIMYGTIDTVPRHVVVDPRWGIKEMREASELLMRYAIDIGNKFLEYNPIGGTTHCVWLE